VFFYLFLLTIALIVTENMSNYNILKEICQ
jgi:hypothetical protein